MDVFFKQRNDMFFPTWAFVVPTAILRFPMSLVESGIFAVITYYAVGLASNPDRSVPHGNCLCFCKSLERLQSAAGQARVGCSAL